MSRTNRFDSLRPGARIYWRGADDDVATVYDNGCLPAGTVFVCIRWTYRGEVKRATLTWAPDSEVYMADGCSPSGIPLDEPNGPAGDVTTPGRVEP